MAWCTCFAAGLLSAEMALPQNFTAPPLAPAAEQRLLSQRYAVTNWDEYYVANNYVGWVDDNTVPVCTWTGVYCNPNGAIEEL